MSKPACRFTWAAITLQTYRYPFFNRLIEPGSI